MKKIAFQIDHPSTFNLQTDTSYVFMKELVAMDYEVFFYNPKTLSYEAGDVFARMQKFTVDFTTQQYQLDSSPFETRTSLMSFYAVFIRQNPPFDMAYITSTYLLDIVNQAGVKVLNNPSAVRNCSEKIFALEFENFMPKTLITKSLDDVKDFAKKHPEGIILKPLYGYGGDGVFYIKNHDKNLFSAFTTLCFAYPDLPLICQEYIPEVGTIGDKRILVVNGKYFKALNRIQAQDMSISNTRHGGKALTCELTAEEEKIVKAIGPRLMSLGLVFVGLDVIGGKYLTEINVTSPTGLALMNQIYSAKLETSALQQMGF